MAGVKPEDLTGHFPALLKDSDWQKKKGKIGRMVKTGLGAELKKVESLRKQLFVAKSKAEDAAKKLKKKPLGGDAAKAAAAVAKAAGQFAVTCKSLDLETPVAKV